ncbi:hypothetical protein [Peribacillus glennii]|uniref:Uncharacterized protein n=1 Tax=Peribacillus glennii TaxID=2303991 RepID=A0A372L8F6_9BACI|nr:hypothetical protein [Peribacillus glennii]RFU61750.1 hypothetical protein D0466_16540 [Peribacillus glennii]
MSSSVCNPKLYLEEMAQTQGSNQKIYYSSKVIDLSKQVQAQKESIQQLKRQLIGHESLQHQIFEHLFKNHEKENPFASLLSLLPENYPVGSIFINGRQQRVTRFLSMNFKDNIAMFQDGESVKTFDIESIDGIIWELPGR